MSMPITLETAVRPPLRRRATARVAVAVAAALIQLPPLRLARVLGVLSRGARPAVRQQALEARRAVVFVSVRCAGQGCLQRSVATILLCRLAGVWPDWCTGVRTLPFRAHAWVEAEGEPVGDPDDTPLYRVTLSVRGRR
ncbi:lasso peptide biosynthesis B2 protein [Streptomyces sp. NBC_01369]|uniref:lasso peptide biosynthesis B2 protein n=1 Tax=unclassified Streptomyces TaxID=2593676 RepID=UPI00224DA572|nr:MULTISPECIES: lasso peptide biosynthesis B2 protein [unclassified Streptomyces]MCX4869827.1 lasso peptide biosynthesis B2 protein [Streptomyces sp. NBC_00906]MCX4900990.1 lasso peptide biosynthesis B2 protein [Streptomyces sp. NBC_00892]